jgi:hypothetical protein
MPRHMSQSNSLDALRNAISAAASRIGYPTLHEFCQDADFKLRTGPDNLKKFGEGGNATINDHDARQLTRFLFDTETGRLLRRQDRQAVAAFDDFVAQMREGSAQAGPYRLEGSYYGFHGSHSCRDYGAKLAYLFGTDPSGAIQVDVQFIDDWTMRKPVRTAYGVARFTLQTPQILTLNNDNSQGYELIVADQIYPEHGLILSITGQAFGMTRHRGPYHRYILLTKTPQPMTLEDMSPHTGIKLLARWDRADQCIFRELARCISPLPFRDPIIELRLSLGLTHPEASLCGAGPTAPPNAFPSADISQTVGSTALPPPSSNPTVGQID